MDQTTVANFYANFSAGQMANFEKNRDLFELMAACPDLSTVNRPAFQKVLGIQNAQRPVNIAPRRLLARSSLLEGVSTTDVAAAEIFVVSQYFSAETFSLGNNFKRYLLPKVEQYVFAATLRIHRLKKHSFDKPIIAALGGRAIVETFLAHLAELIGRQLYGQEGVLLTNGDDNIFYVRDVEGTFWAVYCFWNAPARLWCLFANSVACLRGWNGSSQVFSR